MEYQMRLYGIPKVSNTEITPSLIKSIVDKEDPVILEIGCNDGTNTEWFLKSFSRPTIHCFEPDPRAIKRFRRRIGANEHVQLHEVAVCDISGTVKFHQSSGIPRGNNCNLEQEDWDLSGSIKTPRAHLEKHPWCKFETSIQSPAIRLDEWAQKNEVAEVDFIWMDVQGAELDVFRGGKDVIQRTRFIYTEYSERELYEGQPNIKKILSALPGFKIRERYENDLLLENTLIAKKQ